MRLFPRKVSHKIRFAATCAVSFLLANHAPAASHALPTDGPARSGEILQEIHRTYFIDGAAETGIKMLIEAVLSDAVEYSKVSLQDTILPIMRDYFVWESRRMTFENLIYHIVDYDNIDLVRIFFVGTDLDVHVENAYQMWRMPTVIFVEPEYVSLVEGESARFDLQVRNNLDRELRDVKLEYIITPADCGRFDIEKRTFYAKAPGEVRITFFAQGLSEVRKNIELLVLPRGERARK
jgi:hypothetical protein